MSMFTPKVVMPPPPPPPEPPAQINYQRANILAEEALRQKTAKRKGRGSTRVAGAMVEEEAQPNQETLIS